jgi:hypothetical protein
MKKSIVQFFPLLLLYLLLGISLSSPTFQGDESGYVAYATRLSQGQLYPLSEISLWWGPGYPIVLVPFVCLKLPWLAAKLLNAFFLFGVILYFHKTLILCLEETHALILTFVLGLYPPFWIEVHLLLTENSIFFLKLRIYVIITGLLSFLILCLWQKKENLRFCPAYRKIWVQE